MSVCFTVRPAQGEPVKLDRFSADASVAKVQLITDWGGDQIIRYCGVCIVCRRSVWDGERSNDPRGVMGDHANWPVDPDEFDQDLRGPQINLCALCANDEGRYKAAYEFARVTGLWRRKV